MEELGFVITKDGEVIKFGEYKCYAMRDRKNIEHYHDSAFREVLRKYPNKFDFIEDKQNFEIVHNLELMAKNDCVVLLNATQGNFEASTPTALMAIPKLFSKNQGDSMVSEEETLRYFDGGLPYIDVLDSDGQLITEYNFLDDFYKEVLNHTFISKNQFLLNTSQYKK